MHTNITNFMHGMMTDKMIIACSYVILYGTLKPERNWVIMTMQ